MVERRTPPDLWSRAQSGDEHAFGRLLEAYRPRLLDRIRLMMGAQARQAAESGDLVQDVFVELLRYRERAPDDERALLRWMTAIARNRIKDSLRRPREERIAALSDSLAEGSGRPTPSNHAERVEFGLQLAEALESLPQHYRAALELRSLEELSFRAVGERLGRSEEGARKLHTRALIALGNRLRAPAPRDFSDTSRPRPRAD